MTQAGATTLVSGFIVRCCWRIDAAANRLTVYTGRLAAWATRWDMRRRGEL
jgi:hypothetical protein